MGFVDAKSFGCLQRTWSTQMEKPECNYLSPLFCCLFFKLEGLNLTTFSSFFYVTNVFIFTILLSQKNLHFSKDPLLVISATSSISLILFLFPLLLL